MDKSVPPRGKGSVRVGAAKPSLPESNRNQKGGGGKSAAFGGKRAPPFKKGK